jgi:predicted RNase H-like nuclease
MWRLFWVKRALKYRKVIKQLRHDKAKLQQAIERLEHQLRLARLEEKRLKYLIALKGNEK